MGGTSWAPSLRLPRQITAGSVLAVYNRNTAMALGSLRSLLFLARNSGKPEC